MHSRPSTAEGPPTGGRQPQSHRLFNRDFVLLWQGQLVSRLGDQAFLIAMMFWTKEATGSASVMGLLMMLSALPGALLSPVGGTFADRHSRYRIILGADLVRGVSVLALGLLVLWRPEETGWILTGLFAVAVLGGTVKAVFQPAIAAAMPDLVPRERLATANSLRQLSAQVAVFLGQALGGVLYRLLGAPLLFLADGISYLLSAASEGFIRIPQTLPEASRGWRVVVAVYLRDTREGFVWVWRRTGMRTFLLVASAINFFAMPVFVLLPFYVTDQLGRGAEWYGFLLAVVGAGSVVGYLLVGSLRLSGAGRRRLALLALPATGVALGLVGWVESEVLALLLFFVTGLTTGMINILILTLFQLAAPGEIRGRVLGLVVAISSAMVPLGMGLGGLAGDLTGKDLPLLFGACGTAILGVSLWGSLRPGLREFLGQEASEGGSSEAAGGGHDPAHESVEGEKENQGHRPRHDPGPAAVEAVTDEEGPRGREEGEGDEQEGGQHDR